MSEEPTTKYSSYTPAQKRASQLYRQKNKDKINEQRKKYYQTRKINDPKFLEYKRLKAKEYYEKKKLDKVVKTLVDSDVIMKDIVPDHGIEVVDTKGLLEILVPTSPLVQKPMPEPPTVQLSKMDIDDPIDASVQLSKPLKGKRTTTRKKIKSELDKKN